MNYRKLGKTGLSVSEIGFGCEWIERKSTAECKELLDLCAQNGINILDCWMSNPEVRSNIGAGIAGSREKWYIQGHIGSTWQDGQYARSREIPKVKAAFNDLLTLMKTDYIDLGMIHFVDSDDDFDGIMNGEFIEYVHELKANGVIRHVGMSTHNPSIAKRAAQSGEVEMIMFSINPAYDLLPPTDNIDNYFADEYDPALGGINSERAELYKLCESLDVGITVMKGFAGGRLFNGQASPFGVALTPIQCLHYALTRPAVTSVMVGFDNPAQVTDVARYPTASDEERDYATVLASAPRHAYSGQCTYCGHCKPCPSGIDIAMVNKYYDLAVMQKQLPPLLKAHYDALDSNAADCIGCKSCEERCPFGVKIAEKMENAAKLFG